MEVKNTKMMTLLAVCVAAMVSGCANNNVQQDNSSSIATNTVNPETVVIKAVEKLAGASDQEQLISDLNAHMNKQLVLMRIAHGDNVRKIEQKLESESLKTITDYDEAISSLSTAIQKTKEVLLTTSRGGEQLSSEKKADLVQTEVVIDGEQATPQELVETKQDKIDGLTDELERLGDELELVKAKKDLAEKERVLSVERDYVLELATENSRYEVSVFEMQSKIKSKIFAIKSMSKKEALFQPALDKLQSKVKVLEAELEQSSFSNADDELVF